jgi:hypothetical protein
VYLSLSLYIDRCGLLTISSNNNKRNRRREREITSCSHRYDEVHGKKKQGLR